MSAALLAEYVVRLWRPFCLRLTRGAAYSTAPWHMPVSGAWSSTHRPPWILLFVYHLYVPMLFCMTDIGFLMVLFAADFGRPMILCMMDFVPTWWVGQALWPPGR